MADSDTARVHVVEDNDRIADMYCKWLASKYDADVSYDGEAALDAIDDDVDLVFLDRDLPKKNGGEVLQELRDRGSDVVVAMLTATDPSTNLASMECDDYLRKPVPEEKLLSKAENLLERRDMDDDLRKYLSVARRVELLERKFSSRRLDDEEKYEELIDRVEDLHDRVESDLFKVEDSELPDIEI